MNGNRVLTSYIYRAIPSVPPASHVFGNVVLIGPMTSRILVYVDFYKLRFSIRFFHSHVDLVKNTFSNANGGLGVYHRPRMLSQDTLREIYTVRADLQKMEGS